MSIGCVEKKKMAEFDRKKKLSETHGKQFSGERSVWGAVE